MKYLIIIVVLGLFGALAVFCAVQYVPDASADRGFSRDFVAQSPDRSGGELGPAEFC